MGKKRLKEGKQMNWISYIFLVWVVFGFVANATDKDIFSFWVIVSTLGVWIGWTQYQSSKRIDQLTGKEWVQKKAIPDGTPTWLKPFKLIRYLIGG